MEKSVWEPFIPELDEVFRLWRERDPRIDPSLWMTTVEFYSLIPYLDAVRDARQASDRAAAARAELRSWREDTAERQTLADEVLTAEAKVIAARDGQHELDQGAIGENRRRAEERLERLTLDQELPTRLHMNS